MKNNLKSNTLSKVDSKQMSIPYGALCGSQQIGNINVFTLSSRTSLSSSSGSSSSSSSKIIFANLKIRNTLTITLTAEYENMNVDSTLDHLTNKSDGSNSGWTQILIEQEFENEIESIVNVDDFNISLSRFYRSIKKV